MKTMAVAFLGLALALVGCQEHGPAVDEQEIPGVTTLEGGEGAVARAGEGAQAVAAAPEVGRALVAAAVVEPVEGAQASSGQPGHMEPVAQSEPQPEPQKAPRAIPPTAIGCGQSPDVLGCDEPGTLLVASSGGQPGGGSEAAPPQEPGVVRMDPGLSHPKLLAGGTRDVWVALDIAADDVRPARRLPLNVALVIDRSGSMAGRKLRDVQDAAVGLVDVLEAGDRVSIVSYADRAKVDVLSSQLGERPRRGLDKAIRRLRAAGNTNLCDGLMWGRGQVTPFVRRNQVNRVILLSDGIANRGIVRPDILDRHARTMSQEGVLVSTIGVGDDYNEDLMTSLADYGGGTYSYVRRSEEVAAAIQREAAMMASTVAQRMSLSVDLEPGVQVSSLYGYRYTQEGGTIVVPLAEAFAGQERSVVLHLRVPALQEGPVSVGHVTLSYEDMSGDEPAHRHRAATLEAWATRDVGEVERSVDDGVMARVEEIRIADAMNEAARAIQAGDRVRAKTVLQGARDQATHANEAFGNAELGASIGRAAGLLDALDEPAAFPASTRALTKRAKAASYEMTK